MFNFAHVMGTNPNRETVFRFKKFDVRNDCSAMKVGTDGVLLGAWCNVAGAKRALDVGCGTGLIALMLAQRSPDVFVEAIDIMPEAASEANFNVVHSPWTDRIAVRNIDFNDLTIDANVGAFDLVVSNPPFYKARVKSPDFARLMARHGDGLDYRSLINACTRGLITPSGILSMVLPSDFDSDVTFEAEVSRMRIARKVAVVTKAAATKPSRTLWELTPDMRVQTQQGRLLIGSEEYHSITAPFYL